MATLPNLSCSPSHNLLSVVRPNVCQVRFLSHQQVTVVLKIHQSNLLSLIDFIIFHSLHDTLPLHSSGILVPSYCHFHPVYRLRYVVNTPTQYHSASAWMSWDIFKQPLVPCPPILRLQKDWLISHSSFRNKFQLLADGWARCYLWPLQEASRRMLVQASYHTVQLELWLLT